MTIPANEYFLLRCDRTIGAVTRSDAAHKKIVRAFASRAVLRDAPYAHVRVRDLTGGIERTSRSGGEPAKQVRHREHAVSFRKLEAAIGIRGPGVDRARPHIIRHRKDWPA